MTPQFTHNAIQSGDIAACIDFYQRFCRMRLVKDRVDEDGVGRVVWLAPAEGVSPIFVVSEGKGPRDLDARSEPLMRHFGFQLGSRAEVDALYAEVRAAGFPAMEPSYWGAVAGYLFMVRDPDGRVVEFSTEQDVSPKNWDAAP